jgi:hypothetical protein
VITLIATVIYEIRRRQAEARLAGNS